MIDFKQSAAEIETWVMATCRELGVDVVDETDDFFQAGGTSLSALRLISKIEHEYGEGVLPPEDFFERSAIRQIASRINAALTHTDSPATATAQTVGAT